MERNFFEEIKYQWKYGGVHIKLIGINLIVFLGISILNGIGGLSTSAGSYNPVSGIIDTIFTLNGSFKGMLLTPWGLFTNIFAHYDLLHFVMNMLFLFYAGKMFLMLFNSSRLIYTYVLGGILGGLIQVTANSIFPGLAEANTLGASGSVMAIFIAVAVHRPNLEIKLFGALNMRLIVLALIFVAIDLISIGSTDHVAHFAHLGGALFGFLSVQNLNSNKNIISWFQQKLTPILSKSKRFKKPKMKAQKGGTYQNKMRNVSDEEYNQNKKFKQEQIDAILDKISRSGYDSLTKKEKQILFDKSKNG